MKTTESVLREVFEGLGVVLAPKRITLYCDAIGAVAPDALRAACLAAIRKTQRQFPTPKEILDELRDATSSTHSDAARREKIETLDRLMADLEDASGWGPEALAADPSLVSKTNWSARLAWLNRQAMRTDLYGQLAARVRDREHRDHERAKERARADARRHDVARRAAYDPPPAADEAII